METLTTVRILITAAAVLTLYAPAYAAPPASCEYIGAVSQDEGCAVQQLKKLEQEIAAKYGEPKPSAENEGERLYADSQLAWIKYRDAQCELEASNYGDGSGRGLASLQCAIKKTKMRIEELNPNNWIATGN